MTTTERIERLVDFFKQTLVDKNLAYGNAVFEKPMLLPNASEGDAILVRMSDKINRLVSLAYGSGDNGESFDDTVFDLAGYCILYLVSKEEQNETS